MVDRIAGNGTEHLRRWLLPYLVQLHDLTGLAVAFATLHQGQVHFTNIIYGRTGDKLATVPLWTPAARTASGRLLLAYSSLNGRLAAVAADPQVDPAALSRELWRIRRDGLAYQHSTYVAGMAGMAVALFDRGRGVAGAIGLCGPTDGFDTADTRTTLRHVAGAASTDLRRYGNGGLNGST
jgi:DNA-binding IclR family transcriptional regulator